MKTIEIRIVEKPPCEFESPEDLERYVATLPKRDDNPIDWATAVENWNKWHKSKKNPSNQENVYD